MDMLAFRIGLNLHHDRAAIWSVMHEYGKIPHQTRFRNVRPLAPITAFSALEDSLWEGQQAEAVNTNAATRLASAEEDVSSHHPPVFPRVVSSLANSQFGFDAY